MSDLAPTVFPYCIADNADLFKPVPYTASSDLVGLDSDDDNDRDRDS